MSDSHEQLWKANNQLLDQRDKCIAELEAELDRLLTRNKRLFEAAEGFQHASEVALADMKKLKAGVEKFKTGIEKLKAQIKLNVDYATQCATVEKERDELRSEVKRLKLHLEHRSGMHRSPGLVPGCPGCISAETIAGFEHGVDAALDAKDEE